MVEEDVEQAPEAEGDEAAEGGGGLVTYWHLKVGGEGTGRAGTDMFILRAVLMAVKKAAATSQGLIFFVL